MKFSAILTIPVFLLCAASWWLGRISVTDRPALASPTAGPSDAATGAKNSSTAGSTPDLAGLAPAQAFRMLGGTAGAERVMMIRSTLRRIPPAEWGEWFEKIARLNGSPHEADIAGKARQFGIINDFMAAAVMEDPVGFMAAQNSVGQRNTDSEAETRLLVMMKWAELEPAAAKAHLAAVLSSGNPPPGMQESARFMAMIFSQKQDPDLLPWALSLPGDAQPDALSAALSGLADTDPAGAAAALSRHAAVLDQSQRGGNGSAGLAADIVRKWTDKAPAEALAWAAQQNGDVQRKAMEQAASRWAEKDAQAALSAVRGLPPHSAGLAWAALISRLPETPIPELAGEVDALPAGASRAAAAAAIMNRWAGTDSYAATQWMQQQPAGEVRDAAIERFVRWADVREPEAGLEWAATIGDPEKRTASLRHIAQQLGSKAPEVIAGWMARTAALTPEDRVQMNELLSTTSAGRN